MNTYTIDDVRALAQIYEENAVPSVLSEEDKKLYGGNFSYVELMEAVIKDKKLPEASLLEFVGAYDNVVFDQKSHDMLFNFLFVLPLRDMSTHINDKGSEEWKNKVATWRFQIGK
jgi:hypothetical protein